VADTQVIQKALEVCGKEFPETVASRMGELEIPGEARTSHNKSGEDSTNRRTTGVVFDSAQSLNLQLSLFASGLLCHTWTHGKQR
jgi:hypothetical protein